MRRDPTLRSLRVTAVRGTAAALAVGVLLMAISFALMGGVPSSDVVILLLAVAVHATVAATVGRWDPSAWWSTAYVVSIIGLVLASLTTSTVPDTEGFWFLLIPVGLSAIVLPGLRHLAVTVIALAGYLAAAAIGGGVTPVVTVVRLIAIGLGAFVLWYVVCRLEMALRAVDEARRLANERAERLAVVARSARRIQTLEPGAVLAATLDSVTAVGWDVSAIVLEPELEDVRLGLDDAGDVSAAELVIRTRGLRLPDEPRVGAIAQVLATGRATRCHPADPVVVDRSLASLYAAPITVGADTRGVLVVGCRTLTSPDPTALEAAELLAGQTGRALAVVGRLEREIARVEALEELGRERDDYLATVAHELRTPLTAIIGLSETARQHRDRLSDEQRRALALRVESNARALENIVTAMLDLARLERGTLELIAGPVDLTEVVRRTVRRLAPVLSTHQVEVAVPPEEAIVQGDARLLERVVENLLTNAGRHTPPGTRIVAGIAVDARHVTVRVEDDGPGLSSDEIASLGERFNRGAGAGTRAPGGVGLGMSLVSRVLRLHGTDLDVTSELGSGASFSFSLPVAHEVEVEFDVSRLQG